MDDFVAQLYILAVNILFQIRLDANLPQTKSRMTQKIPRGLTRFDSAHHKKASTKKIQTQQSWRKNLNRPSTAHVVTPTRTFINEAIFQSNLLP